MENHRFSIGYTSSNGGFSIAMLVYRSVALCDLDMELYGWTNRWLPNSKKADFQVTKLDLNGGTHAAMPLLKIPWTQRWWTVWPEPGGDYVTPTQTKRHETKIS